MSSLSCSDMLQRFFFVAVVVAVGSIAHNNDEPPTSEKDLRDSSSSGGGESGRNVGAPSCDADRILPPLPNEPMQLTKAELKLRIRLTAFFQRATPTEVDTQVAATLKKGILDVEAFFTDLYKKYHVPPVSALPEAEKQRLREHIQRFYERFGSAKTVHKTEKLLTSDMHEDEIVAGLLSKYSATVEDFYTTTTTVSDGSDGDTSFILLHGSVRTFLKNYAVQSAYFSKHFPTPALVSMWTWQHVDQDIYLAKMDASSVGENTTSTADVLERVFSTENFFTGKSVVTMKDQHHFEMPLPKILSRFSGERARLLRSCSAQMFTLNLAYRQALRTAAERGIRLHSHTMFLKFRFDISAMFPIDFTAIQEELRRHPRQLFAYIPEAGVQEKRPEYISDVLWVTTKSVLDDLLSVSYPDWIDAEYPIRAKEVHYLDIHSETHFTEMIKSYDVTIRAFQNASRFTIFKMGFGLGFTPYLLEPDLDVFWEPSMGRFHRPSSKKKP